jgi:hypothetical protein
MKQYASNKEFFGDVAHLATRLEEGGLTEVATEMRTGLQCINGLTDGWGELMERLESVIARFGAKIPSDQLAELKGMFDTTQKLVFRK